MKPVAVFVFSLLCLFSKALPASGHLEEQNTNYADNNSITIYSPHENGPLNTAIKEFQETHGIMVDIIAAGTGQLLDLIRQEQKSGILKCDVFWGGGAESIAANADLFEPAFTSFDNLIPQESKDSNLLWIGESPAPVVIIYNTMLLSSQEIPKGWQELLDSKWKGKIAFADPSLSGSAYTLLCTMITAMGGLTGGGWEFIGKLVENLDGKLLESSSSTYTLVAEGEFYIGLTQEKSAQTAINSGAKIAISYPKEGTSAVPDAIAIVKGCDNREGALEFIDFLLGKENQNMMSALYNRRPVRYDLQPPMGLPPMQSIPLVVYDLEWAARNKKEILYRWKNIIGQK